MNSTLRFACVLCAMLACAALPVHAQQEPTGPPSPTPDPTSVDAPVAEDAGDPVTSDLEAPDPSALSGRPNGRTRNALAIGAQMSYQGYLEDANGAVDGTVKFTFSIYSAASGGTPAWSETQDGVPVIDGVYQVALGALTPLTRELFSGPAWLQITVDGVAFTPRTQLLPTPAAYVAESLSLPYTDTASDSNALIGVTNEGSGEAIRGEHDGSSSVGILGGDGAGVAANTEKTGGSAVYGLASGDAYAGLFYQNDSDAAFPALYALTTSSEAGRFEGGIVSVYEGEHQEIELDPDRNGGGELVLAEDGSRRIWMQAARTSTDGASIQLYDTDGGVGMLMDGQSFNTGAGRLVLYDNQSTATVTLDAKISETGGGALRLYEDTSSPGNTLSYSTETSARGARTWYYDGSGSETIYLAADQQNDTGALISMRNGANQTTIEIDAQESSTSGDGGQITLYDGNGNRTVEIDGEYGTDGPGRVTTEVLEITGGSDLAEYFDIAGTEGTPQPGMVVSIDPSRPGQLMLASEAYDAKVAGVISGAGGIAPGMMMGQAGTEAYGDTPVALTGRVYVWATAENGPILPGNRLTSSTKPGYAMLASDRTRADGTTIGKAMTALEEGEGLVLLLVQF
ncbi:MAG: hypothetical protein AAGI08_02205 [Bacteroidota bacterium]